MPLTEPLAPLDGLLLAGGKSRRMGRDKANLVYPVTHEPQWKRMTALLAEPCRKVLVSVGPDQVLHDHVPEAGVSLLRDREPGMGPLAGILNAVEHHPGSAWLVLACDLPLLDASILECLLAARGTAPAVAFRSSHDGLPEPLCALYEPAFHPVLRQAFEEGRFCPRKILMDHPSATRLIDLPRADALDNANTPAEYERLAGLLTSRLS